MEPELEIVGRETSAPEPIKEQSVNKEHPKPVLIATYAVVFGLVAGLLLVIAGVAIWLFQALVH